MDGYHVPKGSPWRQNQEIDGALLTRHGNNSAKQPAFGLATR